jgi:outer membrane receptor protein involved in Fe transport
MLNYGPQIHPSYYDVQGVLAYQLAPENKMLLKFIHAGDAYKYDPTTSSGGSYTGQYHSSSGLTGSLSQSWHDSTEEHASYYSSMVAVQNSDVISSVALLKSEVSYYDELESEHSNELDLYGNLFHSVPITGPINAFYNSASNYLYDNNLDIRTLELNSSYDMQVTNFYGINAGVSYQRIYYYQELINQQTFADSTNDYYYPKTTDTLWNVNALDNAFGSIDAQSYKTAGYIENIFQIGERTILNVGGRFDYFDLDKDLTWSPRVNIAYKLTPELTVRGAWGYFYQSPIYEQLAYSAASDTNTQSQLAIHYVLGAEYELISDAKNHNILKLKLEAYHKTYSNLISSTVSSYGIITYSRRNDAIGRASGLDAYVMYSTPGVSGWISYSLLKADQKMMANDTLGYFPRSTDQRHTIAAVAEFDLGNAWSLGPRLLYGSGYPYTPSVAVYNKSVGGWQWQLGNPNSARLPAYKRVDLRVSKDFKMFGLSASAFLDISNLFDFTNVQAYTYQFDDQGNPQVVAVKLWPILPTLGMTARF